MPQSKILIPKQEFAYRTVQTQRGTAHVVGFRAKREDGEALSPCEVFSMRDTREELRTAMDAGQPVACDVTWNAERQRFDVRLPRPSFDRGRGAGSFRSMYVGPVVDLETWLSVTAAVIESAAHTFMSLAPHSPKDSHNAVSHGEMAQILSAVISEARSVAATYWMAVERNITVPPVGSAAIPAKKQPSPARDATSTASDGEDELPNWDLPEDPPTAAASFDSGAEVERLRRMIAVATTRGECDEVKQVIASSAVAPEAKSVLFGDLFEHKKTL